MNRSKKLLSWTAISMATLVLGYFIIDNNLLPARYDGSTTLTWVAPTENKDNSPLTDLAGYKIHCWTLVDQHSKLIFIDDPKVTTYSVENLSPGTHYCAVTAVNSGGGESALSNVIAKVIP